MAALQTRPLDCGAFRCNAKHKSDRPESEDGKEIASMLVVLNKLRAK
jgi:hypothetical protein